jgi:hypothetical protein
MAAFRRPGSVAVYIGPFRAGAVDVPRTSTKQNSITVGKRMEAALRELAMTGWSDLVREVAERKLDIAELYTARIEGPQALQKLRELADDTLLVDLVEGVPDRHGKRRGGFRRLVSDARVLEGVDQLLALAPAGARLSWLRKPKNVTELYRRAVMGEDRDGEQRAPNSVRRSLHRAVADLLTHELGRGQMLAVMADAKVPSGQDERNIMLSLDEIAQAFELVDEQFLPVLGYALTTGIDRDPMLRQRVHHYDEESGQISVPDEKAPERARTLALRGEVVIGNAEYWLRRLIAGRKPTEPLIPITRHQLRKRWEALRAALGRPEVRWKDLRGVFATYYLLAGGEPRELQRILGHGSMAMTLRYLNNLPAGNRKALREHAAGMGLPGARGIRIQREA